MLASAPRVDTSDEDGVPSVSKNFHEQYEKEELPLPSDRSTGLVFAGVALVVAWFWRADQTVLQWALGVAAAFALVSLAIPSLIRPLNIVWMKFALLLNMIMSPLIMGLLFLIAIVPAGLLMRIRYDPLRKRRQPGATTYWIDRKVPETPPSMSNQF